MLTVQFTRVVYFIITIEKTSVTKIEKIILRKVIL